MRVPTVKADLSALSKRLAKTVSAVSFELLSKTVFAVFFWFFAVAVRAALLDKNLFADKGVSFFLKLVAPSAAIDNLTLCDCIPLHKTHVSKGRPPHVSGSLPAPLPEGSWEALALRGGFGRGGVFRIRVKGCLFSVLGTVLVERSLPKILDSCWDARARRVYISVDFWGLKPRVLDAAPSTTPRKEIIAESVSACSLAQPNPS